MTTPSISAPSGSRCMSRSARLRCHARCKNDVVDRALRQLPHEAPAVHEVRDVPRANVGKFHVADDGQYVVMQSGLVILPIEVLVAALRDERARRVAADRVAGAAPLPDALRASRLCCAR
jgi:hypothetical protein